MAPFEGRWEGREPGPTSLILRRATPRCGDVRPAKGEEHVRRWVVYKVEKEKKKGKKKGAAKDEM